MQVLQAQSTVLSVPKVSSKICQAKQAVPHAILHAKMDTSLAHYVPAHPIATALHAARESSWKIQMMLNVLHAVTESFKMSTLKWGARIVLQDSFRTSWRKVIANFVHRGWHRVLCHLTNVSLCSSGLYSDGDTNSNGDTVYTVCAACAKGTYQEQHSKDYCNDCPQGYYAAETQSSSCVQCGAGKYQMLEASVNCSTCAEGKAHDLLGQTSDNSCVPMYRWTICGGKGDNLYVPTVLKATRNLKKAKVNASFVKKGQYQSIKGGVDCPACVSGQNYSSTAGAETCNECGDTCGDLEYLDTCVVNNDQVACTTCGNCPIGEERRNCEKVSMGSCQPCPPNSYSDSVSNGPCQPCENLDCPELGQEFDSVLQCLPTGEANCVACPAGRFQSGTVCTQVKFMRGECCSSCTARCPAGKYTNDPSACDPTTGDAVGCLDCPHGQYRPSTESDDSQCINCPSSTTKALPGFRLLDILCDPENGHVASEICEDHYYQAEHGVITQCKECGHCVGDQQTWDTTAPRCNKETGQPNCVSCTQCPDSEDLYVAESCTVMQDTVCGQCESCVAGKWNHGCGQSELAPAGECLDCVECGEDYFWQEECSGRQVGNCTACDSSRCEDGEEYLNGCFGLSSGSCLVCPPCNSGSIRVNCSHTSYGVCFTCPSGWAQETASSCAMCQPGRYTGQSGWTECEECERGYFQGAAESSACIQCEVGKVSSAKGSIQCQNCTRGKFSQNISSVLACEDCAAGKFQAEDVAPSHSCSTCPAGWGFVSPEAGCSPCEEGKSQSASNIPNAQCSFCLAGKYFVNVYSQCEDCIIGKFQPSNTTANATCKFCSPGFQYIWTDVECEACPAGKFQEKSEEPNVECKFCAPGRQFVSEVEDCEGCQAGKFQEKSEDVNVVCKFCNPGRQFVSEYVPCEECEVGKFQDKSDELSVACKFCEQGHEYSNITLPCSPCTAGYFQSKRIRCTLHASLCESGKYENNMASSSCKLCPAGKLGLVLNLQDPQPMTRLDECANCSSGMYQHTQGSTVCLPCDKGKFCLAGTNVNESDCKACPLGYLGNVTSSGACFACEVGKYTPSVGSRVCQGCEQGRYNPYKNLENNACFECPKGYENGQEEQTECSECTSGKTLPQKRRTRLRTMCPWRICPQ